MKLNYHPYFTFHHISGIVFINLRREKLQREAQTMPKLDYDNQELWPRTSGIMQSPIDINVSTTVPMGFVAPISLDYDVNATYVHDTGQGFEVGLSGKAEIANRPFNLTQFHIHAPSEHTVNGHQYDAEIHFVHEAQDGRMAVIGVLLEIGLESPTVETMLNRINSESIFKCDVSDLLPKNKSYYHYLGSLTTPPLTENVEWYVLEQVVTLSRAQLEQFHVHYHKNNRDTQPLNERKVLYFKDKSAI